MGSDLILSVVFAVIFWLAWASFIALIECVVAGPVSFQDAARRTGENNGE